MRGGQGITTHWQKFPGITINGFSPMYMKHGQLEQFSCATITRKKVVTNKTFFIASNSDSQLVKYWHELNESILTHEKESGL